MGFAILSSFEGFWPWRWKTIFSPEDIIEMKLEFDSLEKDRKKDILSINLIISSVLFDSIKEYTKMIAFERKIELRKGCYNRNS